MQLEAVLSTLSLTWRRIFFLRGRGSGVGARKQKERNCSWRTSWYQWYWYRPSRRQHLRRKLGDSSINMEVKEDKFTNSVFSGHGEIFVVRRNHFRANEVRSELWELDWWEIQRMVVVVVWVSIGLREWLLEGWLVILLKFAPRVTVRKAGNWSSIHFLFESFDVLVVFGFELDVVVGSEGSRETVGDNGAKGSGSDLLAEGGGDHDLILPETPEIRFSISKVYLFLLSILFINRLWNSWGPKNANELWIATINFSQIEIQNNSHKY